MLDDAPRWLVRLLESHGVRETPGPGSTALILEMFKHTRGGVPAAGDETAWCSAAMCHAFESVGILSTRSKAAISWLGWGLGLSVPRLGCVAVLHRDDPHNPEAAHVALWIARVGAYDILYGGNQANALTLRPYLAARVMSYRFPYGEQ